MILIPTILTFAILANIGLGTTVFLANTERKANQAHLVASTFMLFWLLVNLLIFYAAAMTSERTTLAINAATAISTCIPSSFQLLRLSIKYPSKSWAGLLRQCAIQLVLNVAIIFVCFMPSFTKSVEFPSPDSTTELAHPVYGPLFILYALYFIGSICVLGYNLFLDRKRLQGTQRLESEFLGFACLSGLCVGVIGILFVLIFKSSSVMPITNAASVFIVSLIVAYGITVHKILTVSTLLRKATAYVLITAYLSVVYYVSWFISQGLLNIFAISYTFPAHLISTLVVAFSVFPARQRMQKAADLLFSNANFFDVQETVKKASDIFQSVTTINSLLDHFSNLLIGTLNANHVTILTAAENGYLQQFPHKPDIDEVSYSKDSELVEMLSRTHEPVCADSLVRTRKTPSTRDILQGFKSNKINVATGVFFKSDLIGIVLFGSRHKGRIYDKNEQDAMQLLCNQFAVALENAQLYTEMQDSKIRNDIMLDQLVSGVIVADPERKISLINHEAQRIIGLTEEEALGQGLDLLPESISKALEATLASKNGAQNTDAILLDHEKEERTHVRLGSAYLLGHDNKPMGALLVFTDMTEVKGLEEQVRRSDQLSSVGTLAAGMAHEIKNPLVTIKTFTQLLPERYGDSEFRKDFSSLVAHEVARIDGIVNQLLNFSKPSQPHLVPMKLHGTVEKTLELIHEQLSQKNISLNNKLRAKHDLISGDADLLTQTLVNFNLNAIEAIGNDGSISVSSSNCSYRFARDDDLNGAVTKSCIRLQISDTGKGIEQDQLQKIFDPFFTSKSEGTGMGLSVAHGIIHEHHGAIEVDSRPGKGTTFSIYIPVLEEDTAA